MAGRSTTPNLRDCWWRRLWSVGWISNILRVFFNNAKDYTVVWVHVLSSVGVDTIGVLLYSCYYCLLFFLIAQNIVRRVDRVCLAYAVVCGCITALAVDRIGL